MNQEHLSIRKLADGRGIAALLNLSWILVPDVRPSRSLGTGERRVLDIPSYFLSISSR